MSYWIELSNNDFAVAETLLMNGHYTYTGFMCHQAIEKILKGYFIKGKDETPPFKHDLEFLAQQSGLYNLLSKEQIIFLERLTPLNIEARYPDYKNKIAQYMTKEITQKIYEQTKEFLQWIKKMM